MDEESTIWQNDHIPVQLMKAPYQQVAGMVATMAMRNRTRAAANNRKECEDLYEIDKEATKGQDKKLESDDLTNLNMARTGAAWDRNTAFWAGQCEDQECDLCGGKEEADQLRTCSRLKDHRRRVDEDIAKLDLHKLPAAVKQGVAPAMKANPRNPFLGKAEGRGDRLQAKISMWKHLREIPRADRQGEN